MDYDFGVCFCVLQLFKLGPVQSVCISEGSDTGKEVTIILFYVHLHFKDLLSKQLLVPNTCLLYSKFSVSKVGLVLLFTVWLFDYVIC